VCRLFCKRKFVIDVFGNRHLALFFVGDLERASACLEEVKKHEPEYDCRKLEQSASVGEACIVRALISNGVDVNSLDSRYTTRTVLMQAAEKGHTQVVQMLKIVPALMRWVDIERRL